MKPLQPGGLALVFEDSQVSGVQIMGADLHLRLSAAHVSGAAGYFSQASEEAEGYLAPVVLRFLQARWQGELALAMGRLAGAELRLAGQGLRGLPLPCAPAGPVRARLALANGVVLEIEAHTLECPLSGDEKFTPSLAC